MLKKSHKPSGTKRSRKPGGKQPKARRPARSRSRSGSRAYRALLQKVLDAVPVPVFVTFDRDSHHAEANRAGLEALGMAAGQNVSKSAPADSMPPYQVIENGREADPRQLPLQVAAREAVVVRDVSLEVRHADGTVRQYLASAAPILDERGGWLAAAAVFVDMTDRNRAQAAERALEVERVRQAREASEAKYRALFDSMMDGFVLVGMDGVIRDSNETYRKMVGYSSEELAQVTYEDLTPDRWHAMEARIVEEQILPLGFSEVYEKEYRRKDGTVFPAELRTFLLKEGGQPSAMWAIVRDLTVTRTLQAKLAMASRLAALGTLVSGVAHEINNPLAAEMADQGVALEVVREVREHLRGDSPLDRVADGQALEDVVEALEDAKESAERISRIVKDLSLFGKPDAKRKRVRIMDIVDGAMRWLPATVAGSASVEVENGGAPDVIASPGQIEQILVNLISNAAKATPEGQRGTVILRVAPGRPGTARVEVIDQGTGIDPAIADSIFDPFFTTRPTGPDRGTGLGLATCQAIATAHNGSLTFESEVGKGTTFQMELPAAPAEASSSIPTAFPSSGIPGCPHTVSAQRNDQGYGPPGPPVRD